jgi:nitroreductase
MGEGPLVLVRAAILAANPHNTQPWLFRVSDSSIELYADTSRSAGALDPYLREQHIGLGCALENMMLAAEASGYRASATLLPGTLGLKPASELELVARVALAPGSPHKSELYEAIPHRHTNRNPYEPGRALPSGFTHALNGLAADEPDLRIFLFTSSVDRQKIAHMIFAAAKSLYSDPAVQAGSERWFRTSWSAVEKHRDGLTIECNGESPTAAAIAKFTSLPIAIWLDNHLHLHTWSQPYLRKLLSVPLFGLIAVHDRYDQKQSLLAGRIWQRAHLLATANGLAARPANEAVEMVDHEKLRGREPQYARLLAALMASGQWQPTFSFCMGHAVRPGPESPRRPLRDVVL